MKKIGILLALGVIVGGGWMYFQPEKLVEYDTYTMTRKDLLQETTVRGQVVTTQEVDLGFEVSGKVEAVFVEVGHRVKKGQVLARLNSLDLWSELQEQQARLEAEKARLTEVERGPRDEEVLLRRSMLNQAQKSIEDAEKAVLDYVREAYSEGQSVIYDKSDALFTGPRTNTPRLAFQANNARLENDVVGARFYLGKMLGTWNQEVQGVTAESHLEGAIENGKKNLSEVKHFLNQLALLVSTLKPYWNLSQTTIDQWKLDLVTARTNVNTALKNLTAAEEKWNSAQSSFVVERKQLDLTEAGSTNEQVTVYAAEVKSAEARINKLQVLMAKNTLVSPINGVVTQQEIAQGEIVPANQVLISLIGQSYEIEAEIPELDIAKVKVDNDVRITFDAAEDQHFEGLVTMIEPAGVSQQGVVYYKARVFFDPDQIDLTVRPGMSADLDILTDSRNDVLVVPLRLIHSSNGEKYVEVLHRETNEKGHPVHRIEEASVRIGLKGNDGLVEIVEGGKEGMEVIMGVKK